ncbi:MAG: hypothetical protein Q8M24_08755 [Pseudolabrys sp.]|nr:hypothetical protein [Pseudolabrys sp.]MDP2295536.1 hypothetical protein [Pseudolabrys sp.]
MSERQLAYEDFADKVGEVFPIGDEDVPRIPLTLVETEMLKANGLEPGMRAPFALTFIAKDPRVLPQRIYRLEHNGLGSLAIFLVPIAKSADGVSYQATFN